MAWCSPGCCLGSLCCRYPIVGFYHAYLGFPVKQTWLDAIKANNFDTFDGLTYSNASRHCPDADETIMGHLAQQYQNVWSTKPKPTLLVPLVVLPPPIAMPSNQVFIVTKAVSKLFTKTLAASPSELAPATNMSCFSSMPTATSSYTSPRVTASKLQHIRQS